MELRSCGNILGRYQNSESQAWWQMPLISVLGNQRQEDMLIPQIWGQRPPQSKSWSDESKLFFICVCVCKHAYVYVYGLSLFKMGFKRSSMDMGKIRVFIAQEWGVSKWGSSRQTVGVTEAEHSYNKLVRGLDFSLGEVSLQAQTHQRAPGWQSSWNPLPNPFPAACWGIGEFGCLFLLWKKEIPLSSETCMKDPHCHLVAWFFFNDTSTLPLPYCCLSMANNSSLHVSVSFCLFVLFLRQWLSSPSFLELSM